MEASTLYEIYIGCNDRHTGKEMVTLKELRETVTDYFKKREIDFSICDAEGGCLNEGGAYIFENTLCISIIGNQNMDIVKLGKSLSMYMNQECFLITRNEVMMEYR